MKNAHVLHYKLGPVAKYVPCTCFEDNTYRPPTYWVRTKDSGIQSYYRGPIIEELFIQCDECGRAFHANIESEEIYDRDLNF